MLTTVFVIVFLGAGDLIVGESDEHFGVLAECEEGLKLVPPRGPYKTYCDFKLEIHPES